MLSRRERSWQQPAASAAASPRWASTHLLVKVQRNPHPLLQQLKHQSCAVRVLWPAPALLKALRQQRLRLRGALCQGCARRLELAQPRPGLARLHQGTQTCKVGAQGADERPLPSKPPLIPQRSAARALQLALRWKRTRWAWSGGSRLPGASGAHRSHAACSSAAAAAAAPRLPPSSPASSPAAAPTASMLAFCMGQATLSGIAECND